MFRLYVQSVFIFRMKTTITKKQNKCAMDELHILRNQAKLVTTKHITVIDSMG